MNSNNCCNQDIYPTQDLERWSVSCSTPLVPASNFYTKNEIDEMLEDIEISGQCECDLDDYYTKEEVDAGLAEKLDTSAYTPVSLSGYATEQWVENQNYLTEHQPIKTINGISMVGTGDIEIGSGGTTDLSNYYNKQEVDAIASGKAETSAVTAVNDALTAHTGNTAMHVSSQEKYNWNNKANVWCGSQQEYDAITTKQQNTIYLIHD